MFVQTEATPNPNSLKFLPGKNVSNSGSFEVTKKEETDSELVRNILSINGVTGVFLGTDFLTLIVAFFISAKALSLFEFFDFSCLTA